MRVLVTGAGGQLGQSIQAIAPEFDIEVIAIARQELDITSAASVDEVFEHRAPDLVINTAAFTAVDKAETELTAAAAINEQGPANLALACKRLEIPLIHISTDYVFDGESQSPYSVKDSVNPIGAYGKTKLDGEIAVRNILSEHLIIRTSWVFGPYGNNFMKTMLRLAKERDELGIVADQIGGPTCSLTIARTCLEVAKQFKQSQQWKSGTYHLAQQPFVSWFDFAEAIFDEALNQNLLDSKPALKKLTTEQFPTPAKRPAYSKLDSSKICSDFNINLPCWNSDLALSLNQLADKN